MATTIKLKRSSVPGKKPTTSDLAAGEIGLNIRDGKMFGANSSTVFEIGANVQAIHVGSITVGNGGTTFTLPTARGSDKQFIQTNGSGVLSFQSVNFTSNAYAAANSYVNTRENAIFANVNPRIISVVGTAATGNTKAVQALADAAAANTRAEGARTLAVAANTRAEGARTLAVSVNTSLNAYKANTNPRFDLYLEVANVATNTSISNVAFTAANNNLKILTNDSRVFSIDLSSLSEDAGVNGVFANVNPRIVSVVGTAATANTKAVQALTDAAAANTRAEGARTLAVNANTNQNAYKANVNPRIISVVSTAATANTKAVQALADAAAANTRAEGARTLAVTANTRAGAGLGIAATANTKAVQALADAAAANTRAEGARTLAVTANTRAGAGLSIAATANTKAVQALADAAAANTRAEGARTLAVAANTRAEGARTLAVSANSNLNAYKANTNPRFDLYLEVANASSGQTVTQFKYFPTSNTTIFSGNDADSNALNVSNSNVEAYLNGIKLVKNDDFRVPNSTHLITYANTVNGDSLEIVSYNGAVSILNNTSFSGNSNFDTGTLFVDGTNNRVGIGTTTTTDAGVTITPSVTRAGGWDAHLALQSTAADDFPALLFTNAATNRYGGIVSTNDASGNVTNNVTAVIDFFMSSATDGNIRVRTNTDVGSSAPVTQWQFTHDGNLKAMVNGNGIDFSATEGSGASSSVLYDYEEGTWTPSITQGWTSVTYFSSQQFGKYTKIGNTVHAWFFLRFSGTSAGNQVLIGGLPYTTPDSANVELAHRGGSVTYFDVPVDAAGAITAYTGGGSTTIQFYHFDDGGASALSNGDAVNNYLIGSVIYWVE